MQQHSVCLVDYKTPLIDAAATNSFYFPSGDVIFTIEVISIPGVMYSNIHIACTKNW